MAFKHKDIGPELTRTEWEAVDAHEGVLAVSYIPITSLWLKGVFASRPAASVEGRHYWATDTDEIFRDTGSVWEQVMESVSLKAGDYPTAYVGISASATGRAANLDAAISSRLAAVNYLRPCFKWMPPAVLAEEDPDAETWFTVLNTTAYVRILYLLGMNDSDKTVSTTMRVTIDGQELQGSVGTKAVLRWMSIENNQTGSQGLIANDTRTPPCGEVPLEGHSVKVEMQVSANFDPGDFLRGVVYYQKLE